MKTALVTGANKGIGFETAKQLAARGYFVYIGSRDKLKGLAAIEKLKALGFSNVACTELDVTNLNSIKTARLEIEAKIKYLDVLVSNAGIRGDVAQPASTVPIEGLQKVFQTNFFGAVQMTQEFMDLAWKI